MILKHLKESLSTTVLGELDALCGSHFRYTENGRAFVQISGGVKNLKNMRAQMTAVDSDSLSEWSKDGLVG